MATILKGELDLRSIRRRRARRSSRSSPRRACSSRARTARGFGGDGSLRIPLGALHWGQHARVLVRVRLTDPRPSRQLASSRACARFHDTTDGGLERVQEVGARS